MRFGIGAVLLAAGVLCAQPTAPLTFEVASIKPASPDSRATMIHFMPGGGLEIRGATLRMLIANAYDVRDFQISGGPGWVGSDRFDIDARVESSAVHVVMSPTAATPRVTESSTEPISAEARAV